MYVLDGNNTLRNLWLVMLSIIINSVQYHFRNYLNHCRILYLNLCFTSSLLPEHVKSISIRKIVIEVPEPYELNSTAIDTY
jgi:hypothetical protein